MDHMDRGKAVRTLLGGIGCLFVPKGIRAAMLPSNAGLVGNRMMQRPVYVIPPEPLVVWRFEPGIHLQEGDTVEFKTTIKFT